MNATIPIAARQGEPRSGVRAGQSCVREQGHADATGDAAQADPQTPASPGAWSAMPRASARPASGSRRGFPNHRAGGQAASTGSRVARVSGHGDVAFAGSGATTTPSLLYQQQRERDAPRAACVEATGSMGRRRYASPSRLALATSAQSSSSARPMRSMRASASRADTSDHHVNGDRGTESRSRTRHPPSAHPRSSTSPAADVANTFAVARPGRGHDVPRHEVIDRRPPGGGHRPTSRRVPAARAPARRDTRRSRAFHGSRPPLPSAHEWSSRTAAGVGPPELLEAIPEALHRRSRRRRRPFGPFEAVRTDDLVPSSTITRRTPIRALQPAGLRRGLRGAAPAPPPRGAAQPPPRAREAERRGRGARRRPRLRQLRELPHGGVHRRQRRRRELNGACVHDEHFTRRGREGQGVILATAHTGGWQVAGAAAAHRCTTPTCSS